MHDVLCLTGVRLHGIAAAQEQEKQQYYPVHSASFSKEVLPGQLATGLWQSVPHLLWPGQE
jgi:hypothetical protein